MLIRGLDESLGETATLTGQLVEQANELSEEAAQHGWHGMAQRMQDAGEALTAALDPLIAGQQACQNAAAELGLISEKVPAEEVIRHLASSTSHLGTATTAVEGALEKTEEAKSAAEEVGQEGMMRATLDLVTHVSDLLQQGAQLQALNTAEQVEADAYAKVQLGN